MGRKNNKRFNNRQRQPYHKSHNRRQFNNRDRENEPYKQEFIIKDSLKEDQAAITEYINVGEGFKGILKSRFSDFHVNEIDLTGEILQLNDLSIPEEKEELSIEEAEKGKEELKKLIPEDMWKRIEELKNANHDNIENPKDSEILVEVTGLDKEQRTQVHKVIKALYGKKLLTYTVQNHKNREADNNDSDNKRFIRVIKYRGRGDRKEWPFPKQVVHFLVHKENMDTIEIASAMANKMNMKASQVNYCGTKDKRAKTTQKFSIKKRTPRQIVGTVKYLAGVKIGNFSFKSYTLKLGDLHGNRFRIAIRNLIGDKQHIETSLNNVKEQGFINYFGLQRFGNCSTIPTHEIGVALLKADYKLACELILKPRDNDVPFLKRIREMWWKNRDSRTAAAQFHSERFIEKKVLDGLAKHGENDYVSALTKIPRNMLLLYPHAFQSLIFNQVASRRMKEFGLSLIPGDLVFRSRHEPNEEMEPTEAIEQEEDNDEKDVKNNTDNNEKEAENVNDDNEKEGENATDNNEKEAENATDNNEKEEENASDDAEKKQRFKKNVRFLTEEDIASGEYTIYDVILTLPGYYIAYPDNVVGSWYKELLEKYDLSSEKLKKNKVFSMRGAYRRFVVKPRDMSWEFKSYSTPDETLILSDLEILQGKTLEDFKKTEIEPKYEALLLDFCLPAASYATMMLRELLKCDTSSAAQSILQQAAIKEHTTMNEIEKETQIVEAVGEKRKACDSGNEEESVTSAKMLKDN